MKLTEYIEAAEEAIGKKAIKEMLPLQPGDVPDTYADVSELVEAVGYKPATPVKVFAKRTRAILVPYNQLRNKRIEVVRHAISSVKMRVNAYPCPAGKSNLR